MPTKDVGEGSPGQRETHGEQFNGLSPPNWRHWVAFSLAAFHAFHFPIEIFALLASHHWHVRGAGDGRRAHHRSSGWQACEPLSTRAHRCGPKYAGLQAVLGARLFYR